MKGIRELESRNNWPSGWRGIVVMVNGWLSFREPIPQNSGLPVQADRAPPRFIGKGALRRAIDRTERVPDCLSQHIDVEAVAFDQFRKRDFIFTCFVRRRREPLACRCPV